MARLPFPSDRFDVVLTRYSRHHFLPPTDVLMEMARVCKPSGRIWCYPPEKDAAYDRMERLRDPSHVRVLTAAVRVAYPIAVAVGTKPAEPDRAARRRRNRGFSGLIGGRKAASPRTTAAPAKPCHSDAAYRESPDTDPRSAEYDPYSSFAVDETRVGPHSSATPTSRFSFASSVAYPLPPHFFAGQLSAAQREALIEELEEGRTTAT